VLYRLRNSAQTDRRTDGRTDDITISVEPIFLKMCSKKKSNTLTRHKLEKCQNWIFELILSLSSIPTYFKPNKQKKIKNLPFSIFFRSIISKLKFMEELFVRIPSILFQMILKIYPHGWKNRLKFTSFNGGNWVASMDRCKFQVKIDWINWNVNFKLKCKFQVKM
jgi:hypothetical protein